MTDDAIRDANFEDLNRQYRDGNERVAAALELLDERGTDGEYLSHLLRSHIQEGIYDWEEVRLRDAVDELLNYYSLIELASFVSFLPKELPIEFHRKTLRNLTIPAVRTFYETHYPLLLPRSLRQRLERRHALSESDSTEGAVAFLEFLAFFNEFEADKDVSFFVALMDDYVAGDVSWITLASAVQSPASYVKILEVPPEQQLPLHSGAHGLRRFVKFCSSIGRYLARHDTLPLFRSGAWHYFSYWFRHVEERLGPVLEQLQAQLLLERQSDLSDHAVETIRASSTDEISRISSLTHSSWGDELVRRLSQVS